MIQKVNVVVIGCGIFGAEIALKLSSIGFVVKVFEANHDILMGASMNNQNRLHLGFHYPRDIETGLQSIRGFDLFKKKYKHCIESTFLNTYFIADENSFTNFEDYIRFCKKLGISFDLINSNKLPLIYNQYNQKTIWKQYGNIEMDLESFEYTIDYWINNLDASANIIRRIKQDFILDKNFYQESAKKICSIL